LPIPRSASSFSSATAGRIEDLFQHLAADRATVRREEGRQRHPTHLHSHQFAQVRACDPHPREARRDPFEDEGEFQCAFDAARIDLGPARHEAPGAERLPVALDLADGGMAVVLQKGRHVDDVSRIHWCRPVRNV
jgi:hypothetical protein